MNITTYDYIDSNKRKIFWLIVFFPVSLLMMLFVSLYLYILFSAGGQTTAPNYLYIVSQIFQEYGSLFIICALFSLIWTMVSFSEGSNIILKMTDAVRIKNTDTGYKDIKRILENVAITAGIPTPALYVMENEKGLNAFAVGMNPKNSSVVLTRGIIEVLDNSELEAVIAHEVAHIVHQDTKLMMIIALLICFSTLMASFIIRMGNGNVRARGRNRGGSGKGAGFILILGLILYIYGNFVAPLIRLAISRTMEFKADAKSALLTRNPQALISALRKISGKPIVNSLEENEVLSPMCIANPLPIKISLFSFLSDLSSTHPPVEKRIKALNVMDGRPEQIDRKIMKEIQEEINNFSNTKTGRQ